MKYIFICLLCLCFTEQLLADTWNQLSYQVKELDEDRIILFNNQEICHFERQYFYAPHSYYQFWLSYTLVNDCQIYHKDELVSHVKINNLQSSKKLSLKDREVVFFSSQSKMKIKYYKKIK